MVAVIGDGRVRWARLSDETSAALSGGVRGHDRMPRMGYLIRLAISAVALWITTLLISGVHVTADSTAKKIVHAVAVAAIFGIINAILRPIIKTIGCAFYVLTLGLIAIVVNGLLFLLDQLDRRRARPAVPRRQLLAERGARRDHRRRRQLGLNLVVPDKVQGKPRAHALSQVPPDRKGPRR